MAKVHKEGSNTDKMVNHQLLKKRPVVESMKREEIDLIQGTAAFMPEHAEQY